jgi:hypothetical protein
MGLLEYRVILGALLTTPDGLLVASAGVDDADAELIAATTAGNDGELEGPPVYWETSGASGALRVLSGQEIRLILLTELQPTSTPLRSLMFEHLTGLEHTLHV